MRQLTNYPEHMIVSPFWSPAGDRMACTVYGIRSIVLDLRQPSRPESPLTVEVPGFSGYFQAWSWSKDGRNIAGYLINPDGSEAGIGIYSLQTGKFKKLTGYGMDPVWLNDSRRLLFYNDGRIDILETDTKRTHTVLSVAPKTVARRGFALSPDDRTIYFSQSTTEGDIWLLSRERRRRE
jgi:Tol biopolymer transport system component